MEKVSPQVEPVPGREVGVESAHGFGDCLFNIPLIRELSQLHNSKVAVTVRPHCADAFINVPWVSEIIEVPQMWNGMQRLQELGYRRRFQITQNVKFYEFREAKDPNHSLIHTPLWTGRQHGCPEDFDNKPLFFPTTDEVLKTEAMASDKPTIAIESVFKSAQSWANRKAINAIVAKYAHTHRILWLSNEGAPKLPTVDDMLRFSRRECIMCLRHCEIFFSVGSGFFCSSLSLSRLHQPKKVVCLWTDGLYKYEEPLNGYKWHPDIEWVHNQNELTECLSRLQQSS
jgi:hypothetical protein